MSGSSNKRRKPPITIRQSDHSALTRLAESIGDRNPAVSDELLAELDRAKIVDDARLREDIVRVGRGCVTPPIPARIAPSPSSFPVRPISPKRASRCSHRSELHSSAYRRANRSTGPRVTVVFTD